MKNTNSNSKRGMIKQLLNRETVYSLADYSRKVYKKIGRQYKVSEIAYTLRNMAREGQLIYIIVNNKVHGCLTFGKKAFQIV